MQELQSDMTIFIKVDYEYCDHKCKFLYLSEYPYMYKCTLFAECLGVDNKRCKKCCSTFGLQKMRSGGL